MNEPLRLKLFARTEWWTVSTFDSSKSSLQELLAQIQLGGIQLPDFQRGWVWDDDHIRDLLVSVGRSFPIGAVMLLEAGGDVRFQARPIEGIEGSIQAGKQPEKLILDGQQRLTTLTQALALKAPVETRTAKGRSIKLHYYFDIKTALEEPTLEGAVIAVDEKRQLRSNFGRQVDLDLSTIELECQQLYFPCDQILRSDEWEMALHKLAPGHFPAYMDFRDKVINVFRSYQVPVIMLRKETSKEAVCLVFERVNTGGVPLSVFELITASYAADGYNLRDDWFGSPTRGVGSRKGRIERSPLLVGTQPTEFLQALTLLHTLERHRADVAEGRTGKQVRPVSAKRAAVLDVPLTAWKQWADRLEAGFREVGFFLKSQALYHRRELPYGTQLVPLAAVMTMISERWREPLIYDKLSRWYWCGVFGELYGGAVETRIANDFEELLAWFDDNGAVPRTVTDASFQPERLSTLRTRLSAAYKGLSILLIRQGAKDWFWKGTIRDLDAAEIALDVHHVFPQDWCNSRGIARNTFDSILNKTPLSYKANRKIAGAAPSSYLKRIQSEPQVGMSDDEMDALVGTHAIAPHFLRADDFEGFINDRRARLCRLVEDAMGKPVSQYVDDGIAGAVSESPA